MTNRKYRLFRRYEILTLKQCTGYTSPVRYTVPTKTLVALFAVALRLFGKYFNRRYLCTTKLVKYGFSGPLGITADGHRYAEYYLDTRGDTAQEMIGNATVSLVDQDGGDLYSLELDGCNELVYNTALRAIGDSMIETEKGTK